MRFDDDLKLMSIYVASLFANDLFGNYLPGAAVEAALPFVRCQVAERFRVRRKK